MYFKDLSPDDKRFSHLGIVRIIGDDITVIHAEGHASPGKDFVTVASLDEFLEIARAVGVYRLQGHNGKEVSAAAIEYAGYPFDWNFDLQEDNELYCTELLYAVLKRIAPEINLQTIFQKELKKEIIPLEAISHSAYFTEIVYRGS
jgi:hypothetical protein